MKGGRGFLLCASRTTPRLILFYLFQSVLILLFGDLTLLSRPEELVLFIEKGRGTSCGHQEKDNRNHGNQFHR